MAGAKSGRRPADVVRPGRQEIWQVIRGKKDAFTTGDVVRGCGADRKTVADYLLCLAAGGYVRRTPSGRPGQPAHYEMLRDTGFHAPRLRRDGEPVTQGQAVAQLWHGMCMLKSFTWLDLIQHASIPIEEETAKSYCKMLLATGYLRVVEPGTRNGIARYRLIRMTGWEPPQVQRIKCVYDPNTRTVHHQEAQA